MEECGLSAMLILDLDNFKTVNDSYGHLYGDSVLSQVGTGLKRMFRSRDIIGRIGGDEFLIFMSDIPNEELIHSRCRQILDTFKARFEECAPDMNVSCSIGVALVPDHGRGYNELFTRADKALYQSKSRGKNCYTIYDGSMLAEASAAVSHVVTRIDSEEVPGLADASFVRFVFSRLYESADIEGTFNDILAFVGKQLNVSRVYIFENNEDNSACSNTFEWCNKGIAPEKDFLQNVSYIDDIAGWPEVFNERGVFYCSDISSLAPHFRAILEPQGIKSMLQCAIMDNGTFRGYVGFDECSVHRLWTRDQIELLQFLAEVLAMFLLKKRAQDKMAEQAENLRRILDRQDVWLYVIDSDSCRLKFMNKKAREGVSGDMDLPCYKALRGRDSRCENCPAMDIRRKKNDSVIIDDICFGCRVHANASEIQWNGESACLVFCYELDE